MIVIKDLKKAFGDHVVLPCVNMEIKEREVVVQEIKQTYDDPGDIVFDYMQAEAFGNQAMGRPILGTAELVRGYGAKELRAYMKTNYAAENMTQALQNDVRCGILFGPERTGLHNEDVCLANAIIEIPLNPEHCSLNLSQAVLLVGYEWYKRQIDAPELQFITNKTTLADKEKVLQFLKYFEDKLDNCGNFRQSEKRERMIINLRNIFTRNQLTLQELNTLYGIINYLDRHQPD